MHFVCYSPGPVGRVKGLSVVVQLDVQSEPESVVVPSVSLTVVVSMVVAGGGVPVGPMKGMAVVVQLDVQSVTIKLDSDSSKSRMCRISVSSIRVIQEFSGGIWTYPAVVCFVVFSVRAV